MNRPIRETEFFTTAELAQKLKMNAQVITRKVKAGEIYAFKIGKDWRIPDSAVKEWLERQDNQEKLSSRDSNSEAADKSSLPSRHRHLLEYILAQLEPDRSYSEEELKHLVARQYQNWAEIYGELLTTGMVKRDGARVKRSESYNLLNEAI